MKVNAWRYGFVISYPKGQTAKICHQHEPWRYRYVGCSDAAAINSPLRVERYYLCKL